MLNPLEYVFLFVCIYVCVYKYICRPVCEVVEVIEKHCPPTTSRKVTPIFVHFLRPQGIFARYVYVLYTYVRVCIIHMYTYTYIYRWPTDWRLVDRHLLAADIDVYTLRQVLFVLQHWQRVEENTHKKRNNKRISH